MRLDDVEATNKDSRDKAWGSERGNRLLDFA